MQVEFQPLGAEARDACVETAFDAFLENASSQLNLGTDGVQDGVVGDDIADDSVLFHVDKELVSFLPLIAPGASGDGGVVDVDVGRDAFHFHSIHELEGDVGTAALFHTRHGGTENNDILFNAQTRHFIQVFQTLAVLETLFASGNRGTKADDCNGHAFGFHLVK